MFTIDCLHFGTPAQVTWDEGVLTGDPFAVSWLISQSKTENVEGVHGQGALLKGRELLKDPHLTFLLMEIVFEEVKLIAGELGTPTWGRTELPNIEPTEDHPDVPPVTA